MSIEDRVNRIRDQREQERILGLKVANSFIENVAIPKFEETNRDILKGKGRIHRDVTNPNKIVLTLWWEETKAGYEKPSEYMIKIEATVSKPYRFCPGKDYAEPVTGKEGIIAINPDSPKCEEKLEEAIALSIVNNWCWYPPLILP